MWVAVGGTPQSVVRAASLGLPMALAIIGGLPEQFVPLVDLYRRAGEEAGADPASLAVSINAHGYLADTSQEAADAFFPSYAETMGRIGRERGWTGITRAQYDARALAARPPAGRQPGRGDGEDAAPPRALRAIDATCCSSASARCRTPGCCGRSSCSAPRSRPRSATSSPAARPPATTLLPSSRTRRRRSRRGGLPVPPRWRRCRRRRPVIATVSIRRVPAHRRRALRPAKPELPRPGDVDERRPARRRFLRVRTIATRGPDGAG